MKSNIQFESHHPLTPPPPPPPPPPTPQQQQDEVLKFEVLLASQADHSTNYSLELSLGIPSTSSTTTTSSRATRKAWTVDPLPETRLHNGFTHPWSLAARQQKAVLEQSAPHKHNQYSSTPPSSSSSSLFLPRVDASSLIPVVIGWPPVHAHRKNNLDRTLSSLKVVHETKEDRNNVKRSKIKMDRVNDRVRSMFVKVKMEGYGIGRKVDLKAHDGYRSLSHALRKLFHNFLPVNYLEKSDEQSEEAFNDDFILLYQDIEGDQMLVGDIPWESFITSVEKLFIVQNPKKASCS
ncbi:auxin-responsive protein IAA27-like isoform X1 [Zingiber officinale]|nr:auxin-responsive protein IAA27-like isoform X1 [Zingiber officinale]